MRSLLIRDNKIINHKEITNIYSSTILPVPINIHTTPTLPIPHPKVESTAITSTMSKEANPHPIATKPTNPLTSTTMTS